MYFPRTFLTLQSTLSLLAISTSATFVIQDDYSPSNFASMFDFFTDNDPTNGYVNYISETAAVQSGLYGIQNNAVRMGVDSENVATGRGRNSIRISSKKSYNHGLIILDLAHMPAGACGTWPAFWLLGPNWPINGEVDIIEGVNSQKTNSMAAHTNPGCSITNTGAFSGTLQTPNCDVNAPGQGTNVGCAIHTSNTQSYGDGFNAIGGGVYATLWDSNAISIWFFPRGTIPADVNSANPNPDNWGLPMGQFAGACDIDDHFIDQRLVFDVTFCGDWAGGVWGTDATCAPKAATCQDFVRNNPSAFANTYWTINSLKVFQDNGMSQPQPTTSTILTTTSTTTAPGTTTMITLTSPPTTTFTLTAGGTGGSTGTGINPTTVSTDEPTTFTTIRSTTTVFTTVFPGNTNTVPSNTPSPTNTPPSPTTQSPTIQSPPAGPTETANNQWGGWNGGGNGGRWGSGGGSGGSSGGGWPSGHRWTRWLRR